MSKKKCMGLQESIGWCEGTPEPAGIRRRSYYISMADCLDHPKIPVDEDGRPTSSILTGQFVLAADKTFKYIDFLPEKSQFQSDPQGDYPPGRGSRSDKRLRLHQQHAVLLPVSRQKRQMETRRKPGLRVKEHHRPGPWSGSDRVDIHHYCGRSLEPRVGAILQWCDPY